MLCDLAFPIRHANRHYCLPTDSTDNTTYIIFLRPAYYQSDGKEMPETYDDRKSGAYTDITVRCASPRVLLVHNNMGTGVDP